MVARQPALFLDRDGVINLDHGYVCRSEDFEFINGIFDLCRTAKRLGYLIVVVTNQAGIGRGYYSEADFAVLTSWMVKQFAAEGILIDAVYYSPFHPEHGIGRYKVEAFCRKPNPGMILQAAEEYGIDLALSVLVGDKISDIEAGRAAGVGQLILYRASAGGERVPGYAVVASDLAEITSLFVTGFFRTKGDGPSEVGPTTHERTCD